MTPLHYCCASSIWRNLSDGENRFLQAYCKLLSAGAGVDTTAAYYGLSGVTPLFCAAWTGGHRRIVQQLLERGAAITQDIFFAAVGHFQRHGDGNYDVAELLLEHGFDINRSVQRTAFHAFASHEDACGVAWLIEHAADVDAIDSAGNTPLMAAARRNSGIRVLRLLVDAGCSIAAKNHDGQTALELAAASGKPKSVEYLSSLYRPLA